MSVSFGRADAELVSLAVGTDSPGLSAGLPGAPERKKAVNLLGYARLGHGTKPGTLALRIHAGAGLSGTANMESAPDLGR